MNYLLSSRSLELFRFEEQARTDQLNILEQIHSVRGDTQRLVVDLARIELSKTEVAMRAAEGQIAEAKAISGSRHWNSCGGPPGCSNLCGRTWIRCRAQNPFSRRRSNATQLLNRLDIRRSLAQYASTEADLQLEIAKQYPDINIGPGYTYEERNSFFTLGLSSAIPLFNRNQGPIAEAEARRKEAAAAFLQTQAQVVAKSERALAIYTAALRELAETQSLYQLQEIQLQIVQQGIRAGADNRLNLDGVQIQLLVLARARLDALGRALRSLGDLEDAVQRPLDHEEILQIRPETPALEKLLEPR